MWPKLVLPSVVPDADPPLLAKKNCGVLVAPNASRRNSTPRRSVSLVVLDRAASRLKKLGPLRKFRPTLPNGTIPVVGSAVGAAKLAAENQRLPGPMP